jgi:hypothetical protein
MKVEFKAFQRVGAPGWGEGSRDIVGDTLRAVGDFPQNLPHLADDHGADGGPARIVHCFVTLLPNSRKQKAASEEIPHPPLVEAGSCRPYFNKTIFLLSLLLPNSSWYM